MPLKKGTSKKTISANIRELKMCNCCRGTKPANEFYTKRKYLLTSHCKECIKTKRKEYVAKNRDKVNKASSDYYYKYRKNNLHSEYIRRATKTGLDGYLQTIVKGCLKRAGGDITADYLEGLYMAQGGRCALTGWQMTYISGKGHVQTNISVDRIIPGEPYIKDNVRLTCRAVNVMRNNLSDEEFIEFCKGVINYAAR